MFSINCFRKFLSSNVCSMFGTQKKRVWTIKRKCEIFVDSWFHSHGKLMRIILLCMWSAVKWKLEGSKKFFLYNFKLEKRELNTCELFYGNSVIPSRIQSILKKKSETFLHTKMFAYLIQQHDVWNLFIFKVSLILSLLMHIDRIEEEKIYWRFDPAVVRWKFSTKIYWNNKQHGIDVARKNK